MPGTRSWKIETIGWANKLQRSWHESIFKKLKSNIEHQKADMWLKGADYVEKRSYSICKKKKKGRPDLHTAEVLTIKFWQNGCQLVSTCSKKLSFYSRQLCCVCTFVWICCRKLWIFDELLWSQGYSCFVESFLLYLTLIVSKPSSPASNWRDFVSQSHSPLNPRAKK